MMMMMMMILNSILNSNSNSILILILELWSRMVDIEMDGWQCNASIRIGQGGAEQSNVEIKKEGEGRMMML